MQLPPIQPRDALLPISVGGPAPLAEGEGGVTFEELVLDLAESSDLKAIDSIEQSVATRAVSAASPGDATSVQLDGATELKWSGAVAAVAANESEAVHQKIETKPSLAHGLRGDGNLRQLFGAPSNGQKVSRFGLFTAVDSESSKNEAAGDRVHHNEREPMLVGRTPTGEGEANIILEDRRQARIAPTNPTAGSRLVEPLRRSGESALKPGDASFVRAEGSSLSSEHLGGRETAAPADNGFKYKSPDLMASSPTKRSVEGAAAPHRTTIGASGAESVEGAWPQSDTSKSAGVVARPDHSVSSAEADVSFQALPPMLRATPRIDGTQEAVTEVAIKSIALDAPSKTFSTNGTAGDRKIATEESVSVGPVRNKRALLAMRTVIPTDRIPLASAAPVLPIVHLQAPETHVVAVMSVLGSHDSRVSTKPGSQMVSQAQTSISVTPAASGPRDAPTEGPFDGLGTIVKGTESIEAREVKAATPLGSHPAGRPAEPASWVANLSQVAAAPEGPQPTSMPELGPVDVPTAEVASRSRAAVTSGSSALADLRSAMPAPAATQIAEAVIRLAGSDQRAIEIRLSPEELGAVRFTLSAQDDQMHVHIAAERPETVDLIRRNIDHLLRDLRDAGHVAVGFSFGGGESQGAEQDAARRHAPNCDELRMPVAELLSPIAMQPRLTPGAALDLRL